MQVVSWSDMGYIRIEDIHPGVIVMQPVKKPRGGELAADEKEYNKNVSSVRIKVEHAIGKLKHYAVLRNVYTKSDERLYQDLQIISGLVNHHMLWNQTKNKVALEL